MANKPKTPYVYHVVPRNTTKFLAMEYDGSAHAQDLVQEFFGVEVSDANHRLWSGKWIVGEFAESPVSIMCMTHEQMYESYMIDNPQQLPFERTYAFVSPKKRKEMFDSIMKPVDEVTRTLTYTIIAVDEIEAKWKIVHANGTLVSDGGGGQFTGGYFEEEYEYDDKLYIFTFEDYSKPTILEIFE